MIKRVRDIAKTQDPSVRSIRRTDAQTFYAVEAVCRACMQTGGALIIAVALAACGTAPKSGGYYQNDGPPPAVSGDARAVPDVLPQIEPIRPSNARPYTVLGRSYVPMTDLKPYRERGLASWYGRQFHKQKTASGEIYDMFAMTAAHKTLPIPSYARVTSVRNGRSIIVRINDRGPFYDGRVIDLSYAAAVKLAGVNVGTQEVVVELLLPDEIARIRRNGPDLAQTTPSASGSVSTVADNREASSNASSNAFKNGAVTPIPSAVSSANPAPTLRADTPSSTTGVMLQLGAFSERLHAESLRARLARSRPKLAANADIVLRDNVFRLQIGPYSDAIEAQSTAAQLRDALGLEAVLVDLR